MALSGFRKKKSGDEKATCIKQWEHTLALWMSSPREAIARARRSARREGIPAQIRAKAWFALVGNPVRVTPRLYDILLDSVKTEVDLLPQTPGTPSASWRASRDASEAKSHAYNNPIKTTDDCSRGGSAGGNLLSPPPRVRLRKQGSLDTEGSVCGDLEIPKLIRTDINRTFAHLSFFQRGCLLHDQLMELLCVYAKYRPDVGYIQGMSFVAGHLLLYFEDVYMAFVVLANLLNMPLFSTLFKPKASRHAFTEIYNLHRELLESHLPHLAHHFHEEGIEPDLYMLEWLITLFARRLRLDTLGRVWDMYLTHGEVFVHKVAIAIVKILEKALLSTGFAGCLKILKESPASIDPQTLIATCEGIRLRSSDLTQLTETHMKEGGRGHYISEA
uniref:Rab-GAP TBC domain-containing protein n=1 Tax=Norrisiella sphaerica TaxID=552664 RepID=A0A7S2QS08_9EUKA|mmetsp:Transcript_1396/g.1914  ORF Transcript_1396/g.1914 Transcript_1396/m.1914 type:complete len:389 (+) Transcript_1396:2-1168(+)